MGKFLKTLYILILVVVAFLLGLKLSDYLAFRDDAPAAQPQPQALSAPELRVYDGSVQWNDGVRWHTLCDVRELTDADPIAHARRLAAEQAALSAAPDEAAQPGEEDILGFNRGVGAVAEKKTGGGYTGGGGTGGGTGGGGTGGGGGGGSDGEDISWSSDYL